MMQMVNFKHHAIHVGLILILSFVLYPAWEKASRKRIAWYDYLFTAIAIAEPIYVFIRYNAFISTGFKPSTLDVIMGTLLVILVHPPYQRHGATHSVCHLPALWHLWTLYSRPVPPPGL